MAILTMDDGWWMMDSYTVTTKTGTRIDTHSIRCNHQLLFQNEHGMRIVSLLTKKHGLSWYDFQFSDRESWIINQLEATLYWWVCRLGFDDGDAEWCHMFPLFSWKEARSGYRNLMDLRKTLTFLRGESFRKSSSTSSWWHSYTYIICYDVRFRYFPFQME